MRPLETELLGPDAKPAEYPAVLPCRKLITLTQRRDFQRAARGKRVAMHGFVLQMRKSPVEATQGIRIGYTCSKKVGNAVARNRAKRRLREAARAILPRFGEQGVDYVLIGRNTTTATQPFGALQADLEKALAIVQGARK